MIEPTDPTLPPRASDRAPRKVRRAIVVVAAATAASSAALLACSGGNAVGAGAGDGGDFTGVVRCGETPPPNVTVCQLVAGFQGGLSETFEAKSCGDMGSAALDFSSAGGGGWEVELEIQFDVDAGGVPVDRLGTFTPDDLQIVQYLPPDAGVTAPWLRWKTPPGACSITITGSICGHSYPPDTKRFRYLSGTGTCTQPAVPTSGNDAGPITIGDFRFAGEVLAPP